MDLSECQSNFDKSRGSSALDLEILVEKKDENELS